ncbi:MAG: 2-phospho-L-lactate transferase CofD family protein, partial [Gammaproteobacteria bacterium]|nr:2-phospho-L-lactate transferase CofD family protein [Gammaproteobacteria bacterium]
EGWFRLGDRDLATHVLRTLGLGKGKKKLGEITQILTERLGVQAQIVPMSDDPVRTLVHTRDGKLSFQEYFVRDACDHVVTGFEFAGAETATPSTKVLNALTDPGLEAIIICPSNPYISIDPILAVPDYRQALKDSVAPVVAVSPVIGGNSIKGPTAKIMHELGVSVHSSSISEHYGGLLDGLIVDSGDHITGKDVGIAVCKTRTVMETLEHKKALAADTLEFAGQISRGDFPVS